MLILSPRYLVLLETYCAKGNNIECLMRTSMTGNQIADHMNAEEKPQTLGTPFMATQLYACMIWEGKTLCEADKARPGARYVR